MCVYKCESECARSKTFGFLVISYDMSVYKCYSKIPTNVLIMYMNPSSHPFNNFIQKVCYISVTYEFVLLWLIYVVVFWIKRNCRTRRRHIKRKIAWKKISYTECSDIIYQHFVLISLLCLLGNFLSIP